MANDGSVKIGIEADSSGFEKEIDKAEETLNELGETASKAGKETNEAKSKFQALTDTIAKQEQELSSLKSEYTAAIVNFGKGSTEAKELKAKMQTLNDELGANKDKLSEAEAAAGKFSSSLGDAGGSVGALDIAAGNFIADGLMNLISGLGDAVGELMGLAEATREYRDDMAKLETAFSTAGHSTETAAGLYEDFYAILGESDRSVEAVNHLAEFTSSTEDLAKWADIAAGVTAKFGDSLPIEGLTEAANETAKVGQVTGPLADALNWAGISEDEFNEKLAACNSEQERAALITETLNQQYKAAADEYNELTASTQDARRATSQMEEAQADLGAAIEPVTTAWTSLKANALEAILPVVQTVAGWIEKLVIWLREHETAAAILTAVVIALATALGVLAAALGIATLINTVRTAFASLNLTMLANPIVLIVAAIAALVAAFIYLWNNCEGFRNFWIGLWENIKAALAPVIAWFSAAWDAALAWLKETWATVQPYFQTIWDAIKAIFSVVKEYLGGAFATAWEAIKAVWDIVSGYFEAVWETIKGIFAVVKAVLSGNFSDAWAAIKGIISTWASYFSGVWDAIKGVFAAVGSWFSATFQAAKENVVSAFSNIGAKFTEIKGKIFGAFDSIKSDFMTVGRNILDGIWGGITAGWDWLVGEVKSLANSLFEAAKGALGIKSPSRKFMYVGEMSAAGISAGWEDEIPNIEKQLTGDLNGLTGRIQASVDGSSVKAGHSMGRAETGFTDLVRAVGTQTAGINSLSAQYRRGAGNMRPVVLQLNGRELGRAMVDVGGAEETRTGVKLSYGGAY